MKKLNKQDSTVVLPEEEDYIPSQEDPDMKIILEDK